MNIKKLHPRIISIIQGQKQEAVNGKCKDDARAENMVAVELNRKHAAYPNPFKSYTENGAKYEHLGDCILLTLDYYERKYKRSPYQFGKLRDDAYKLQCTYGDLIMCELFAPLGGRGVIAVRLMHGTLGMEVKYQKHAGTTLQKNTGAVKYDTVNAEDKQQNTRNGSFKNGWLHSYEKVRKIIYVTHSKVVFIGLEELRSRTIENPNAHSKPGFGAQKANSKNVYDLPYNYLVSVDDLSDADGTLNFDVPEYFTHTFPKK